MNRKQNMAILDTERKFRNMQKPINQNSVLRLKGFGHMWMRDAECTGKRDAGDKRCHRQRERKAEENAYGCNAS